MTTISINEAAKRGFKSRTQINTDVKSGKLPTKPHPTRTQKRKVKGKMQEMAVQVIELSDLVRLYGEPGGSASDLPPDQPIVAAEVFKSEEIEQLKAEKARLETELREARDTIKEKDTAAEKERDRFMGLLEDGNKRLEDLRQDIDKANKPLLKKLFGG